MVDTKQIIVTSVQETWTGITAEEYEFKNEHGGYLFLLKRNKNHLIKEVKIDVVSVLF